MASVLKQALLNQVRHTAGQIESWEFDTVINGAVVVEDMDNYTLGELHYVDGELCVKPVTETAKAEDVVLLVTPEQRLKGEEISAFFNGKGERATCAILKQNFQFSTSAIEGTVAVGDVVDYNTKTKKFKKVEGESTFAKGFRVAEVEAQANFTIDELTLVSLNVIK